MARETLNEFVAEPFTNEFGQIVNPGDPVIFVGTCWGNSTMRRGTFEGVWKARRNESWTNTKKGDIVAVKVSYDGQRFEWNDATKKGKYVPARKTSYLWYKRVFPYTTEFTPEIINKVM